MIQHLDEGLLQAYADSELGDTDRVVVRRHLEECGGCRAELDELQSISAELTGGLLLLDQKAPPRAVVTPLSLAKKRWSSASFALPRAAVLVLCFAAAASAMIPGWPLNDLLRDSRSDIELARDAAPTQPAAAVTVTAPVATEALPEAGVSVALIDGAVRIEVKSASPELNVRMRILDVARAGVFANGEAASARFTSAPGSIEVQDARSGELRIEIPRSASSATILDNGRDYTRIAGDLIRMPVPAASDSGPEVTFRP